MSKRQWSDAELATLAVTAVDNALDFADSPEEAAKTFQAELDFQLNAPELKGKPALTERQVAIVRTAWHREMEGRA